MVFSVSGRSPALWILLGCVLSSCGQKLPGELKAPKKEMAAARASKERRALNHITAVLRELVAAPSAGTTAAARAAHILTKLQSVPIADLPESLQAPWQEMTAVLAAAASAGDSSSSVPAVLRQRGEAAAAALNTALAAEGLTDFRF